MPKLKTAAELYTPPFAHSYATLQHQYFQNRPDPARTFLYQGVQDNVKPGSRLLDIGCGDGRDMAYYGSKGYEAWGIDSAEPMVHAARETIFWGDRVVHADFLKVRLTTLGSFQAITSRFVLHYVQDLDAGWRRIAGLLQPRGILVSVFAHPAADRLFSKKPRPGKLRIVRYPLFHGKVTVEYPAHTLSEYFSPTFFQLFDLLAVDEEPEKFWVYPNCPGHLGILARVK